MHDIDKDERYQMGLASTQARFLGITARKNACEFRSMGIAQEKLGLTRDLQKATDQYNSRLNATKLIWNADGSGGYEGAEMDLTYDVMMNPSPFNDYLPYVVTDKRGQAVLTPRLAQAAKSAGILEVGGTMRSEEGRNNFLKALASNEVGLLAPSIVRNINKIAEDGGETYGNIGVGGLPMDKTRAFDMNLDRITLYVEQVMKDSKTKNPNVTDQQQPNIDALAELLKLTDTNNALSGLSTGGDKGADKKYLYINGAQKSSADITLNDLLTSDVVLTFGDDAEAKNSNAVVSAFISDINSLFQKMFGNDSGHEPAQVFAYAEGMLKNTLTASASVEKMKDSGSDAQKNSQRDANKYNGWVTNGEFASISLSNLVESYLTYYAQAMGGFGKSGYGVDKEVEKSVFVTDDPGFNFLINNVYNEDLDTKTMLYTDFYNALYNTLCQNGWTTSTYDLNDKDYLNNALKNGHLFISSLNDEGYYYQGGYTRNGHVVEVTDKDAVARAESEFNQIKARLNYKDEVLEVEMKNIDMEIATLSTEYDTVKSMISKNVEKVFNLFQ